MMTKKSKKGSKEGICPYCNRHEKDLWKHQKKFHKSQLVSDAGNALIFLGVLAFLGIMLYLLLA